MAKNTPVSELIKLIDWQKRESFTNPATAADTDALGILIAHWAQWDGEQIMQVMFSALEDANFHTFEAKIRELWTKEVERYDA